MAKIPGEAATPQLTKGIPSYRLHKASDQAIVTLNDQDFYLGPLGTKASKKDLHGHTPARDFGQLEFKAVRQKMIDRGLRRGVINQRMGRIRRVFRWAVENAMVPPSVFHGLQAVRSLQRGRPKARESVPVNPVLEAFIQLLGKENNREGICCNSRSMAGAKVLDRPAAPIPTC